MRPILRKIDVGNEYSFSIREDIHPYLYNHWHYHPEVELTLIRKSSGTRLVGDHMERFADGDLVLLGANLPHMWRNDEDYFQADSDLHIEAVAVHFLPDCWGQAFLNMPEMKQIKNLLKDARQGIKITGMTNYRLREKMEQILMEKNCRRITSLINILHEIALSTDKAYLSNKGFLEMYNLERTNKINEIYNYTFNNFMRPIKIEEVAKAVYISPHSFCRYFKTRTSKTYIQFLTEIRIGYACKLILENQINISQICYASGFNNLSNFNRRFKEVTGKTPYEYYKHYTSKTG